MAYRERAPAGVLILGAGAAFGVAEAILTFGGALPGLVAQGLLMIGLLRLGWRQESPVQRALLALALLPLLRILSVVMPIEGLGPLLWYGWVGVPLLLGAWLAVRALDLTPAQIGLRRTAAFPQIVIALSGPPLGLAAYALFHPVALVSRTGLEALLAAAILIVFAGFAEELIFRGILQATLEEALSFWGVIAGAALYAVAHLPTLIPGYILYMGGVGLLFGWAVRRTGSTWGVIAAHAGFSICLLLVGPLAGL